MLCSNQIHLVKQTDGQMNKLGRQPLQRIEQLPWLCCKIFLEKNGIVQKVPGGVELMTSKKKNPIRYLPEQSCCFSRYTQEKDIN